MLKEKFIDVEAMEKMCCYTVLVFIQMLICRLHKQNNLINILYTL